MKRTLLLAAVGGLSALANAQAPAKPDPHKPKRVVAALLGGLGRR